MDPTQLTVVLAVGAALLGVGVALIVWVWATNQIRMLRQQLDGLSTEGSRIGSDAGEMKDQVAQIQSDLSSSCEFLRGEAGALEKSLQGSITDGLTREEKAREKLTATVSSIQAEMQKLHESTLVTLTEISETQRNLMDVMSLRERESQARDRELERVLATAEESLSNTVTTRFKQLNDSFQQLQEQTDAAITSSDKEMTARVARFIAESEKNFSTFRQEVGKEIAETRAYIEDSLRERSRDLMA